MKRASEFVVTLLCTALCAGLFAPVFSVPVQAVGSKPSGSSVSSGSSSSGSGKGTGTAFGKLQREKEEKKEEMPELYLYKHTEYKFTDDYRVNIASANYDEIRLSEKSAEDYPDLAETLELLISIKDEDYVDAYNDLTERGEEILATGTEEEIDGMLPFRLDSQYYVRRADPEILSIAEQVCLTGGGDELAYFQCFTFDVQTGEWIAPEDVLVDDYATAQLLAELIRDAYPRVSLSRNKLTDRIMTAFEEGNFEWTAEQESMTFWFDAYTIEEDTGETMIMSIPYEDDTASLFPEFFTPQNVPWGCYFPEYYPVFADLDMDGTNEIIRVWGGGSPEYDYGDWNESINISINGEVYNVPAEGYDLQPILVKTGGKLCLFNCTVGADDYRIISCFDLMGTEPEHLGDVLGSTPFYPYRELPEDFFEHYDRVPQVIWTDFLDFKLSQRLYVLGTSTGIRPFYLSRTGLPIPDEDVPYEFYDETELELLLSMRADRVDEDGEFLESVRLTKGTILTPYRTDAETYVDLITDDGQIVRFELEADDWPHLVNGMDVDDVFEGLLYAG